VDSPRVVLNVTTPAAGRGPVTAGVPWPCGAVPAGTPLALEDAAGRPVPLQAKVTDRWADGSARWVLLDWRAAAGAGPYTVVAGRPPAPTRMVCVENDPGEFWVDTGAAIFQMRTGQVFPFQAATVAGKHYTDPARTAARVEFGDGRTRAVAPLRTSAV
jgi:hypothetical protein